MSTANEREPTTDAVEILRRDLVGSDPQAAAEYERAKADLAVEVAKREVESEVASSALSSIPLNQAPREEGMTMRCLRVHAKLAAERAARQQAASSSQTTNPVPPMPIVVELGNLPPNCDVPMLIEEIEDGYRHLWGSYLALARHFEASGDAGQAAIYNEKFDHFFRLEMDLYLLSPQEWWTHKTEVLPPLIKEMRAVREQVLGY